MAGRRVISYDDVVRAATTLFVETGTVEMEVLAGRLAVSRATLYRVVTSREALLIHVIWRSAERSLRAAAAETPGTGVERLVAAGRRHLAEVVSWEPFCRFLTLDIDLAQRVLFNSERSIHKHEVGLWQELLEQAEAAGELVLPYEAGDAAQLLVSVAEVVIYKDLFVGRPPNLALASAAQTALLRGLGEDADARPGSSG